LERLRFTGIEPDELADAADFDSDSTAAVERDFDHGIAAGRTWASGCPCVMNGVQPNRID